VVHPSDQAD